MATHLAFAKVYVHLPGGFRFVCYGYVIGLICSGSEDMSCNTPLVVDDLSIFKHHLHHRNSSCVFFTIRVYVDMLVDITAIRSLLWVLMDV